MSEPHLGDEGSGTERLGEVVESASNRFTAQCYRLHESPPLGAFVRVRGDESRIYAVVCSVSTEALDRGRPVMARGEDEGSEEDIYRSNPQLARLLCTRFDALIVGHGDGSEFNQYLPPLPPRIHSFVYPCASEEVRRFTSALDYLYILARSPATDRSITDEVIAACVRGASRQSEDSHRFLVEAGKALAEQLAGDPPRLNSILRRLSS